MIIMFASDQYEMLYIYFKNTSYLLVKVAH